MSHYTLSVLVVISLGLGLLVQNVRTNNHQCGPDMPQMHRNCSICDTNQPKRVTIRVRNNLKHPYFDIQVLLKCTIHGTLLYMMEEAADANNMLKFTATYYGSHLGYFVESINNVHGNYSEDKSYWEILDGSYKQVLVGISNYVPKDGETVTFNFTRGEHN